MAKNRLKESINIVLVITVIAIVSATLLAMVNKFTKIDSAKVLTEKLGKAYNSAIVETLETNDFANNDNALILNAFKCQDEAVIIHSKSKKAYKATGIEVLVIIKENKIHKVVKYAHQETPGLGSKALDDANLSKFSNLDLTLYESVSIKSTGNKIYKIDGITSATYSSDGVAIAINNAIKYYKSL